MLGELTAGQVAEWEAFHALEPWGGVRDDLRAGTVAASVVNAAPFGGPRRPKTPADFFPTLAQGERKRPTRREVADSVWGFFRGLAAGA